MSDESGLAKMDGKPESGMARVKSYMLSPEVKERFAEMMGANGIYYLNQVLIVVASSEELQRCEPKSILVAAMRAASLRLSVDPGQGQAWIIPYKGKATFQLGYRGVYELALRTNLYRFINVVDIYEGEETIENRMTGNHTLGGKRKSDKVIARMLYFQLFSGFEKTFVMSVQEIEEHARRYSQAYNSGRSKWNDPVERPKMERKTVLVNGLRKWGRFNQSDADAIDQIESEQGWTGELPAEHQVTMVETAKLSEGEVLRELGYGEEHHEPDQGASRPLQDASRTHEKNEEGKTGEAAGAWTNTKVSLELAKSEKSSDGMPYWEMATDNLSFRFNSLKKILAKNGMSEEERSAKMLKKDVIEAILAHRAQGEGAF